MLMYMDDFMSGEGVENELLLMEPLSEAPLACAGVQCRMAYI